MPKVKKPNPPAGNAAPADKAKPTPISDILSPERQAQLTAEALALGDETVQFPGRLARRAAWSGRIQLAAERDSADLVLTPFIDEPPLTKEEITTQRDRIEFLRITQSRWLGVYIQQRQATLDFESPAAQAIQGRETLLRYFGLIYRKSVEGQKWLAAVRAGKGDADLVQDVSDIVERAKRHEDHLASAPRAEKEALAKLRELLPILSRLLAAKALSGGVPAERKLRDAAYTLVVNTERRIRAAAEYWYDGADKLKDYAPFPVSSGGGSAEDEAEDEEPAAPPAEPTPGNTDKKPS